MRDDVPRNSIRWLADRWHVSMTEDAITAEMIRRTEGWPAASRAIGIRFAIRCHRANRRRYGYIMGGMS